MVAPHTAIGPGADVDPLQTAKQIQHQQPPSSKKLHQYLNYSPGVHNCLQPPDEYKESNEQLANSKPQACEIPGELPTESNTCTSSEDALLEELEASQCENNESIDFDDYYSEYDIQASKSVPEFSFIDPFPEDFTCPICCDPLYQAIHTGCDHYFCESCDFTRNKIGELKVKCTNEGCRWVGKFRDLQRHLDHECSLLKATSALLGTDHHLGMCSFNFLPSIESVLMELERGGKITIPLSLLAFLFLQQAGSMQSRLLVTPIAGCTPFVAGDILGIRNNYIAAELSVPALHSISGPASQPLQFKATTTPRLLAMCDCSPVAKKPILPESNFNTAYIASTLNQLRTLKQTSQLEALQIHTCMLNEAAMQLPVACQGIAYVTMRSYPLCNQFQISETTVRIAHQALTRDRANFTHPVYCQSETASLAIATPTMPNQVSSTTSPTRNFSLDFHKNYQNLLSAVMQYKKAGQYQSKILHKSANTQALQPSFLCFLLSTSSRAIQMVQLQLSLLHPSTTKIAQLQLQLQLQLSSANSCTTMMVQPLPSLLYSSTTRVLQPQFSLLCSGSARILQLQRSLVNSCANRMVQPLPMPHSSTSRMVQPQLSLPHSGTAGMVQLQLPLLHSGTTTIVQPQLQLQLSSANSCTTMMVQPLPSLLYSSTTRMLQPQLSLLCSGSARILQPQRSLVNSCANRMVQPFPMPHSSTSRMVQPRLSLLHSGTTTIVRPQLQLQLSMINSCPIRMLQPQLSLLHSVTIMMAQPRLQQHVFLTISCPTWIVQPQLSLVYSGTITMVQPQLQLQLSSANSCTTMMVQPLPSLLYSSTTRVLQPQFSLLCSGSARILQLQRSLVNSCANRMVQPLPMPHSSTSRMVQPQLSLPHSGTAGMVQLQLPLLHSGTTTIVRSQLQLQLSMVNSCLIRMLQPQLSLVYSGTITMVQPQLQLQLSSANSCTTMVVQPLPSLLYSSTTRDLQPQLSLLYSGSARILQLQRSLVNSCANRMVQPLPTPHSSTSRMVQPRLSLPHSGTAGMVQLQLPLLHSGTTTIVRPQLQLQLSMINSCPAGMVQLQFPLLHSGTTTIVRPQLQLQCFLVNFCITRIAQPQFSVLPCGTARMLQLQCSLVSSSANRMVQPLSLPHSSTNRIVQLQLFLVNSESSTVQMVQLPDSCISRIVQLQFESLLSIISCATTPEIMHSYVLLFNSWAIKMAQLQLNSYTTSLVQLRLSSFNTQMAMSQLWEFPLNCYAIQMSQQQLPLITTDTEMIHPQLSSLYFYAPHMAQLQLSCIGFGTTEMLQLQFSQLSCCASRTIQLPLSLISLCTTWMAQLFYCTNIFLNKKFIPPSLSLTAYNFTPQLLPDNCHIEQLSHIQLHTTASKQFLIMKTRIHYKRNLFPFTAFTPSKYASQPKLNQLHKSTSQKPIKFNHHAQLKSSPRKIKISPKVPASGNPEYPPNTCTRLSSSISALLSSQVKKKLLKRARYKYNFHPLIVFTPQGSLKFNHVAWERGYPQRHAVQPNLEQMYKNFAQKPINFKYCAQLQLPSKRVKISSELHVPASSLSEYPPNACSRMLSPSNVPLSSQVENVLLKTARYKHNHPLTAFAPQRRVNQPHLNRVHKKLSQKPLNLKYCVQWKLPSRRISSKSSALSSPRLSSLASVPLSSKVKNRCFKKVHCPPVAFTYQNHATRSKLNQMHEKSPQIPKQCAQVSFSSRGTKLSLTSLLPASKHHKFPSNTCSKPKKKSHKRVPVISHPTGKKSTNSKKQPLAKEQKQQPNPPRSTPPFSQQRSTCSSSGGGGSDDEDDNHHRKRLKSQCEADQSTGDLLQAEEDGETGEISEFDGNFEEEITGSLEVSNENNPSLVSGTIPTAPEDNSSKDGTRIITDKTQTPHLNHGHPPGTTALTLQTQGRSKLGETPISETLLPGFEVPLKGPSPQEQSHPQSIISQESIPVTTDLKPSDSVEESLYLPQCSKQIANQTEATESQPPCIPPPTDPPSHSPPATHSKFEEAVCETNQATHTAELALPSHKTIKFTGSVSIEEEAEEQSTLPPSIKSFHSIAGESSGYKYNESFFCDDVGSNKLSPLSSSQVLQFTNSFHQVNESTQTVTSTSGSQQMITGNISHIREQSPPEVHPHGSFSGLSCSSTANSLALLNPPPDPQHTKVDGWSDDTIAQVSMVCVPVSLWPSK